MRCEVARAEASAALDGELAPQWSAPLSAHLAACQACTSFHDRAASARQMLRFELVEDVPDVAPAVMAELAAARPLVRRRRGRGVRLRRLVPVAAAFAVGAVAGATFVVGIGGDGQTPAAAVSLPDRIIAAQETVRSLTAAVSLVERGWHPDVPVRQFAGDLAYLAPESLALNLGDLTDYPSSAWPANDVELVVDTEGWWARGRRACPTETQPDCTPRQVRARVVERREPFADATPVPLDLVTPVASFLLADEPPRLGNRSIAGRVALGVVTTAAQVEPLLGGLRPAGNLREVHPADRVELWLDDQALVPLALDVLAAPGVERERWAAARGYVEPQDLPLIELRLDGVVLNADVPATRFPPPPDEGDRSDAGFLADAPVPFAVPAPAALTAGLAEHRRGAVRSAAGPVVGVRTWTDGRAWVKVRAAADWEGGRLFGDLGSAVRQVDLGPGGVGYASEDGSRLGLHTRHLDVVVIGSVAPGELRHMAGSLGLLGLIVPASWDEAASATVGEARHAWPGLLLPAGLQGFGAPALRLVGEVVTAAFAGPGERGFVLTQAPGSRLAPPLEDDVRGVRVRGTDGRWSPGRGELEWVEAGSTLSLRSATLSFEELWAIAGSLSGP